MRCRVAVLLAMIVCHLAGTTRVSFSTVFVDRNATGTATGGSWHNAWRQIQSGIDAAAPGEQVWVASGEYAEAIILTTGVAVYGGFAGGETGLSERDVAANVTTIDGAGRLHVVTLNGVSNSKIDGFTITGGNADGAAPDNDGGGIYCQNGNATNVIANCIITGNHAGDEGGGLFAVDSAPDIRGCAFIGNTAGSAGGAARVAKTSTARFSNCVFLGNQAPRGGAMHPGGDSLVLLHCTFVGNTANAGEGTVRIGANNESASITNCLFQDNGGVAIVEKVAFTPTIDSCLFSGNPGGDYSYNDTVRSGAAAIEAVGGTSGILDADPLLANPTGGDLHLRAGSPCVDAGADVAPLADDIEGTTRPLDGDGDGVPGYDIGAYEYAGPPPPPPVAIHVDRSSAAPDPDGKTWASAFTGIGPALAAARARDVIWVARGEYHESIAMKSGVGIYGGFEGWETDLSQRRPDSNQTTLNASGSTHAVVMRAVSNTRLDGLAITGGRAYSRAGSSLDNYGGGILCVGAGASNIVANCRIFDNQASLSGGGIYCLQDASPEIVDCEIAGNVAGMSGGGLYCGLGASPDVIGTGISSNTATFGAGVYCNRNCSPRFRSCRILDNVAANRGGGVYLSQNCSPPIVNSIFAGNSSGNGQGGALYCLYNSSPALIHCTIVGNSAGLGGGLLCSAEHKRGDMTLSPSTPTIANTIFSGQSGRAVYELEVTSDASMTHCLFHGNFDGDVYDADTTRTLTGAESIAAALPEATNILDGDPMFVNVAARDYRLLPDSPCIDTGTPAGAPAEDIAGCPRPVDIPGMGGDGAGLGYDIGAHEFQPPVTNAKDWMLY